MGEPGGLPCMGLQRVGHDWSDSAAAAALKYSLLHFLTAFCFFKLHGILLGMLYQRITYCSIAKLYPTLCERVGVTLCDPTDCSTQGFHVLHYLPEFAQTRPLNQRCHPTISSSVATFSSCLQSFPASGSFLMSQLFTSGSQSTGSLCFDQHQSFQWIFRVDFL